MQLTLGLSIHWAPVHVGLLSGRAICIRGCCEESHDVVGRRRGEHISRGMGTGWSHCWVERCSRYKGHLTVKFIGCEIWSFRVEGARYLGQCHGLILLAVLLPL